MVLVIGAPLVGKNCPELAVIVVFIPCLIETCLFATDGAGFGPPLPRLNDFRLTPGIIAAAGT